MPFLVKNTNRFFLVGVFLGVALSCWSCASHEGPSAPLPESDLVLVSRAPINDTAMTSLPPIDDSSTTLAAGEAHEQEIAVESQDGAVPDPDYLAAIMGDENAALLLERAQKSPSIYWIASHPEELAFEGDAVLMKLLNLAAKDDEGVEFVRQFANTYPTDTASEGTQSSAEGTSEVPLYYQWDRRWGYTIYSSTAFGLTGCGPAAFCMAYQGVSGKNDMTPYDISLLAQDMGYMEEFEGTPASFFYAASDQLGIGCTDVAIDLDTLRSGFDAGHVFIANMAHGYFSSFDGHYLVLTGIDENGQLLLNDPYSSVNSHQSWDIDFIFSESKGLYEFWAL